MSNKQALLTCVFGWGKICRLYDDSLEIAGKSYNLEELTSLYPSYRVIFGIPSARLELSFGSQHLVLRGIANLENVRAIVSYLQPYCSTAPQAARSRLRSRSLARAQARAWERTNKMPATLVSADAGSLASDAFDAPKGSRNVPDEPAFETDEPFLLEHVPQAPVEDTSLTPGETLGAFARIASNLCTYISPLPIALWQPPRTPRFLPPLHTVHLIPPDQKFDSGSMPVPAVKPSVLPIIHVPVHLQHGECAHYSIGATLCSDRIAHSARATYPPLDHGLLILTNRRVLYVGKRCHFTLAYMQLWYVSLLHTAIALHIEGQFRRIIIELEHPHEWASRIELLAFIARRAHPRLEPPTLAVPAVPGLNMTAKRQAIKPPLAIQAEDADSTPPPPLSKPPESRTVEDETIDLGEASGQACTDPATPDFLSMSTEPMELEHDHPATIVDQPTMIDMRASEIGQTLPPENAPTQTLDSSLDVACIATQEFLLSSLQPATENTLTQTLASSLDVACIATQEFPLSSLQPAAEDTPTQTLASSLDVACIATQEFPLSSLQPATENTPTQTLASSLDVACITTQEFPLSSLQPATENTPTPATFTEEPDEAESDREITVRLYERKLSQLHTDLLDEPAQDNACDKEITAHRIQRVQAPGQSP